MFAVLTVEEDVIFVPPVSDVYHPLKVYPVFVGVGRVPYDEANVTVLVAVVPVPVQPGVAVIEPPFALTVTVYLFASHFA